MGLWLSKVLLVYLVHAVVNDELDELFEYLDVGSDGFEWVALLPSRAVVDCWFDVPTMVFI